MGPIKLDPRIMSTMKTWGGNYDSATGNSHNTEADVHDASIESKSVTLNIMSKMDASHAKPSNMNPGCDMGFLNKAKPQMDTTGHGKLSRSLKD